MGSMIVLAVGRLEIDWGKNSGFTDHSALFQQTDLAQVPYYYVDEANPENENGSFNLVAEYKDGMSKRLADVIDRINLLGHTPAYARREFDYLSQLNGFETKTFSFDDLAHALASVDVQAVSADYGEGDEDFGKFFHRYMLERLGVALDPVSSWSVSEGMENLSAYTVLQLLARNPLAASLPVTWQFADVEHGGWAHRSDFLKRLEQSNRFLIVTEGSSDAGIIKHAFRILKPHIADFFDFVDMAEGYPFSGTGNLFNFTKGLISISVQNNVVVIYDNDAEGVYNFDRTSGLNIPDNMRILKLPDLPEFTEFETVGTSGHHRANINRRAAAIECYLDTGRSPIVRWKNFHKDLGVYHGELIDKTDAMNRFYSVTDAQQDYDFSKIVAVLEMIVSECVAMRERALLKELEAKILPAASDDD
ncbi:MAG: hypothetical protein FJX48_12555 [Alphaproteobacteria bacterium]|nr:hypothetical protein [Alphaproteobacteria bacterium]